MKKQIKDILINAKISIKWQNFGTWTKEDISNLYEACGHYCITFKTTKELIMYDSSTGIFTVFNKTGITKTLNQPDDKEIIITLNKNITIEMRSNIVCLERDVATVIKMYLFYLGDKIKFVTRFNTDNIN